MQGDFLTRTCPWLY